MLLPNSWKLWGLSPDRLRGGGSTRVPRGSARPAGWCEHKKEHRVLLGISPELTFFGGCCFLGAVPD